MIQVQGITKSYGTEVLFRDVTFNVNPRERIGVVGRNGNGKTTLFNIILGTVEPESGAVSVPRDYRIGHLDQHLRLTQDTVVKEASLGLPFDRKDETWQAEALLATLGFPLEYLPMHPSQLSGGFQVRLSLAKLLLSEPDLLLLDEPTNYLDIVSIRALIRFLRSWKHELMLITHDRSFMDSVITHTLGLHRERARKLPGGTDKYYAQIAREEEIYEKTRLNDEYKRKEAEVFISRFRAKARLAGLVQSRIKSLAKLEQRDKLTRLPELEFSFKYTPFPAKMMLEAKELRFSYMGEPPYLIDGFKVDVARDDRIAVIGRNGKGKSTLLKLLVGELMPQTGEVRKHARLKAGYFGQTNVEQLQSSRTIEEEIMAADPELTMQQARTIAGTMFFSGDLALKKIEVLSGGERSRVLLGKIIATPCNLLVLDEPTNHLDMESCDALLAAIDGFDGAVVIVTHNEMFLHTLATRLVVFDDNTVTLFEGSYQTFLDTVGLREERDAAQTETRGTDGRAKAPVSDQRALRQNRAELVRERARAVKPLSDRVERLERTILQLEAEETVNHERLAEASQRGDGATIAALAKRNHAIAAETERLYEELDEATRAYEAAAAEYDERMTQLVGA